MKKPLVLAILDGFGIAPAGKGNAITLANTPTFDMLMKTYPHTQISGAGLDVGLPDGQMGNSEVGHTNMGAGRIVYQELTRITKAAEEGTMRGNEVLLKGFENAAKNDKAVHLWGLLSDGGVHSHISHLFALLDFAKDAGVKKLYVHLFMDGRDTAPTSGAEFIAQLETKLADIGLGEIASISGRYYAMDRDNRWERVHKAYDAVVEGNGVSAAGKTTEQVMEENYANDITDEFIVPVVFGAPKLEEGDTAIFFNFRPDRARELTRAIVEEDFAHFDRPRGFFPTYYVCMTQYDITMPNVNVAYLPEKLTQTIGEVLSKQGKTQLRSAETEKYAHVTFFFNGGVETVYEGEDRILVPSPKVATYDLQPEMNSVELTDKLVEALEADKYDVVILNYANCDMVGHSGKIDATIKAVEAVDTGLGRLFEVIDRKAGTLLVTADHGNAEKMLDTDGSVFTAHTINHVPFIVTSNEISGLQETGGRLCDIAPTMLALLGIEKPEEMTGHSLLI